MHTSAATRRSRRCYAAFGKARTQLTGILRKIWAAVEQAFPFRQQTFTVVPVAELPDALNAGKLYVLSSPTSWAAAMLCPCGCHDTIQLSLLREDSPSWRLFIGKKRRPTLEPSIRRTRACRAHFFLRAGKINWCDSLPPSRRQTHR